MTSPTPTPTPIDIAELLRTRSVAQLNQAADDYFVKAWREALLQKPFSDLGESAEIVLTMLHVLRGLNAPRGARVLDFGAGTCWSSHIMAGFGYEVVATDVSRTALALGEELMRLRPILVPHTPVAFLPFDGHRLDLPDASIDAVTCISALHHVPNPAEVLAELARVLKPWGRAGFSEPGPRHSTSLQSQWEMQTYGVVENDVDVEKLWSIARQSGFTEIKLGLFQSEPFFVTLPRFDAFVAGERYPDFEEAARGQMRERRLFVLSKVPQDARTSASPEGLDGTIETSVASPSCTPGASLAIPVTATNTGSSVWRPSDDPEGPVRIGAGWVQPDGSLIYARRTYLPPGTEYGIRPGESTDALVTVGAPTHPGQHTLRLQLVADWVTWFGPAIDLEYEVGMQHASSNTRTHGT